MNQQIISHNYSAIGDITTIIMCIVFLVLLVINFNKNTFLLKYYKTGLICLFLASIFNIWHHVLLKNIEQHKASDIYNIRSIYFVFIYATLLILNLYINELAIKNNRKKKLVNIFLIISYSLFAILTAICPFFNIGFHIKNNIIIENYDLEFFRYAYILCILSLVLVLYKNKKYVANKIYLCMRFGFYSQFIIMFIQSLYHQLSFLNISFLVMFTILLYCIHQNSYDLKKGTLESHTFEYFVKDLIDDKQDFGILSLEITPSEHYEKNEVFFKQYLYFVNKYFSNPSCFNMSNNQIIFVYTKKNVTLLDDTISELKNYLKAINNSIEYNIVLIKYSEQIKEINDYLKIEKHISPKTKCNDLLICTEKDIENYYKQEYIIKQLMDIQKKNDLNDERVLVYCQPVLNLKTKTFKSAEALMRMRLDNGQFLFPDQFIPLAEQYDCIHSLTKIILNKVCLFIKENENNLKFDRISVNFSLHEFDSEDLVESIKGIIKENNVPFDKIAIEITETEDTTNFENIKSKIAILKALGMKFYLDDFGTGYSNFEKILELPFDVIKFDRSMVILSHKKQNHKTIVSNLSKTFDSLGYLVLFEGVEDENDENMCAEMNATLSQGYKYSKPVEIEKLKEFFQKK